MINIDINLVSWGLVTSAVIEMAPHAEDLFILIHLMMNRDICEKAFEGKAIFILWQPNRHTQELNSKPGYDWFNFSMIIFRNEKHFFDQNRAASPYILPILTYV